MTRRRSALFGLAALVTLLAACASDGEGDGATRPSRGSVSASAPVAFCSRLGALDEVLRTVRSWGDGAASVGRYTEAIATLDDAFRKMRGVAPAGVDLAPIEYANGRFGEIVRAMPADLDGPSARAAVAINLESYNAAVFQTLVAECGPESVDA